MGRLGRTLTVLTLLLLITFAVGAGGLFFVLNHGEDEGPAKEIILQRGSSLQTVAHTLHSQGVIARPKLFKWLMRLTGGSHRVRAGEFAFHENMSALSALSVLYESEPITHSVTIPEGYSVRQIADVLAEKQLGSKEKFLSLALSPTAAEKYGIKAPSLEGFLYPDTYAFSRIDSEEKMIERMVQHFMEIAKPLYREHEAKTQMSFEQVTTLASIIEKETGTSDERALISSVFHNRLKKRMRLQSDPTTIYGIANYNGNITKKDLQTKTPYNTYKINGLPPGPIASPGLSALKAALEPAQSDFLFFVASTNGNHIFSKDYKSHTKHVQAEQVSPVKKNRRKPASWRRK